MKLHLRNGKWPFQTWKKGSSELNIWFEKSLNQSRKQIRDRVWNLKESNWIASKWDTTVWREKPRVEGKTSRSDKCIGRKAWEMIFRPSARAWSIWELLVRPEMRGWDEAQWGQLAIGERAGEYGQKLA